MRAKAHPDGRAAEHERSKRTDDDADRARAAANSHHDIRHEIEAGSIRAAVLSVRDGFRQLDVNKGSDAGVGPGMIADITTVDGTFLGQGTVIEVYKHSAVVTVEDGDARLRNHDAAHELVVAMSHRG